MKSEHMDLNVHTDMYRIEFVALNESSKVNECLYDNNQWTK